MNTYATSAKAVHQFFENKLNSEGKKYISSTKITKLSYYAYAWYLVVTDNEEVLFPGEIKAYPMGPVPMAIREYSQNKTTLENPAQIEDQALITFLEWVYSRYGKYSENQLIAFTHHENTWHVFKSDIHEDKEESHPVIEKTNIYNLYNSKIAA